MRSAKSAGRIIGLALLVQLLLALPVYFAWMRPVTGSGFALVTPVALANLALILWLIARGLAERQHLPDRDSVAQSGSR